MSSRATTFNSSIAGLRAATTACLRAKAPVDHAGDILGRQRQLHRQPLTQQETNTMSDDRTNYEYERDECSGMARFLGAVAVPLVLIGLLASAPAWGQSADWETIQQGSPGDGRQSPGGWSSAPPASGCGHSGNPCQRSPSLGKVVNETGVTLEAGARRAKRNWNDARNRTSQYSPANTPGRGRGDPGGAPNKGNVNAGR